MSTLEQRLVDLATEIGTDIRSLKNADKTKIFEVQIPSASWVVVHNLGSFPQVTTVDSAGTTVEGDVVYDSFNQFTVNFAFPFSGKVYYS